MSTCAPSENPSGSAGGAPRSTQPLSAVAAGAESGPGFAQACGARPAWGGTWRVSRMDAFRSPQRTR
eukprot:364607-Chlamydomonas_euryale.AAC.7